MGTLSNAAHLAKVETLIVSTTLAVRFKKSVGTSFIATRGVPQKSSLPKFSSFYDKSALTRIESMLRPLKHSYPIRRHHLSQHIEYAVDTDVIVTEDLNLNHLIKVVEKNLAEFNLQLEDTNTRIAFFVKEKILLKSHCWEHCLMMKASWTVAIFSASWLSESLPLDFVWKKTQELSFYETFVEPNLHYDTWTWVSIE